MEYFCGTLTEYYGYDFHYYQGEPVDEAWIEQKIRGFTCLDGYIEKSYQDVVQSKEISFKNGETPLMSLLSPLFPATRATAAALRISCSVACGL